MATAEPDRSRWVTGTPHPIAFWLGTVACVAGVGLHLPMYAAARDMGYRMAGMTPDLPMIIGMALIVAGLASALYGLIPPRSGAIRAAAGRLRVRALDDVPIRRSHVALLSVLTIAVTIDVMKPTTLSFVAPGMAAEYGLVTAANPHGHGSVTWLPLFGITGTVVGSFVWGWVGDRIGRRSSILYAGLLFVTTAICGTMPGFGWNLLMCFLMGIGAGGMLPIAFALIAETIPARHRGWLIVLVGGDVAAAYALTSWLAGSLTPEFGWRIMWLLGLPTGVLLILLNRWIPESPRYLLATGRRAAAELVMRRYGAVLVTDGGQDERTAAEPAADRYSLLFRGRLRGPTVAIGMLALAAGLLTFGFQFWVPTNMKHLGFADVTSDFVLRDSALLGLPLTIVVAVLYGRWHSRRTIVLLSAVTALAVLGFAVLGEGVLRDRTVLSALLAVALAGISSLTAVVTAYAAEVYPTRIRSRGTGFAAGMTKAGGVLVLAVLLAATTIPSFVTTALIGAVPIVIAVLVFVRTGPDTHRRRLEDIDAAAGEPVGGARVA